MQGLVRFCARLFPVHHVESVSHKIPFVCILKRFYRDESAVLTKNE
jgi:hypothetical protein